MSKLCMLLLLFIMVSCRKEQSHQPTPMERTDFFSNEKDLDRKIRKALSVLSPNEELETIESVSYIDSKEKSFAFVFYKSNAGSSNIVLQKKYTGANRVEASTIKCDGAHCECKVKTVISSNGDVSVECNCSSCTMLIDNFNEP